MALPGAELPQAGSIWVMQSNEKEDSPLGILFFAIERKNGIAYAMPYFGCKGIRWPAQPYWNGGIWYKRTRGTEYRSQWP